MKFLLFGFITWHLAIFTCAAIGPIYYVSKPSKPDNPLKFGFKDIGINESGDETFDIVKNVEFPIDTQSAIQLVARGERNFSTQFFKLVSPSSATKNYVCSPLSIYMALSMLSYGSREYTKTDLFEVLGIPKTESNYAKKGYEGILADLVYYSDVGLSIKNNFLRNFTSHKIKKKYTSILKKHFIKPMNNYGLDDNLIKNQRIGVINSWRKHLLHSPSENKIGHTEIGLKSVGSLTSQLIFKGVWEKPFDPAETSDRFFYQNGKHSQKIPTMYIFDYFRYGTLPQVNATFVELPFKSYDSFHAASMFLVLSNDPLDGLDALVKNIDKIDLKQLCDDSVEKKVHLYLPTFMIKYGSHIRNDLRKKMGLGDVLSIRSDFEGISKPGFEPGKVYHQAMINVTEQGTGSFAESPMFNDIPLEKTVSPVKEDANTINFDANHPFLTIIALRGHIRVHLSMSYFVGP